MMWETWKFIPCFALLIAAFNRGSSRFLLAAGSTTSCTYINSSIPTGRPNVTSEYLYMTKLESVDVKMPCRVLSNPTAHVQWLFNGRNIKYLIDSNNGPPPKVSCNPPMSTLHLWNVRPKDEGNYTCVATNTMGKSNWTFHLEIIPTTKKIPVIVNDDNTKYKAYLGASYNLSCDVKWPDTQTGKYAAFWRQGKRAKDTARHELLSPEVSHGNYKYKMSIRNVSMADQGSWECRASYFGNPYVNRSKTLTLQVVPCPAGYYCPWNESTPRPCEYGTYNGGTTNTTYRCKDCPHPYVSRQRIHGRAPAAKSVARCPVTEGNATPRSHYDNVIYIVAGVTCVLTLCAVLVMVYKVKIRSKYQVWPNDLIDTDVEINYDVFISFSEKDQEFATTVHNKIEEKQYKCCYHHRDFSPGESIVKNIADAIYQSTITLVILSPDFMSSKFCQSELTQALTAAMANHRVLPVLYKPCRKLPPEIQSCFTYLEYKREEEEQFWKKLFNAIEKYCNRAKMERGVETNV